MATFGPVLGDGDRGKLTYEKLSRDVAVVYYEASPTRLKAARLKDGRPGKVLILRFDAARRSTTIYPVNAMPSSDRFLEPKHAPIEEIELIEEERFFDRMRDFPQSDEEVYYHLLENLPLGFTKDPDFGLGLDRKFAFITDTIARIPGVRKLRITHDRTPYLGLEDGGTTYGMSFRLFHDLRKAASRFETQGQVRAREKKRQTAYNVLLREIDEIKFPALPHELRSGDLAETIGIRPSDELLSEKDREAVVGMATAAVRRSLPTQKGKLLRLHEEIELASLDELIAQMRDQFAASRNESHWQRLFQNNPLILDLAFGNPVVVVQGQAHVGGKRLSGSGEKITDFLLTNRLTDVMAVVEIKTPQMELISAKEYRGGVFGPSAKLTEAIAQLLNQIDNLRSDIYGVKARNPQHRLEAYGIKGVVVAGLVPDKIHKRSFELYRSSLMGVTVITFDELLAKLQSLRTIFSPVDL